MQAIILAGGMGTRLHSITRDRIPKAMALVQGKPFIYWQLKYLNKQNIKKVNLAVYRHADQIQNYLGTSFENMELHYSVETTPLGTGGAVKLAMTMTSSNPVLVLNGDTWFPVNLESMKHFHQEAGNQITLALKKLYDFDRYGSVVVDKRRRIIAFKEKQKLESGFINGGIYLIQRTVMDSFMAGETFSIERELFELHLKQFLIGGYKSTAKFIDIGVPEDYELIQKFRLR